MPTGGGTGGGGGGAAAGHEDGEVLGDGETPADALAESRKR